MPTREGYITLQDFPDPERNCDDESWIAEKVILTTWNQRLQFPNIIERGRVPWNPWKYFAQTLLKKSKSAHSAISSSFRKVYPERCRSHATCSHWKKVTRWFCWKIFNRKTVTLMKYEMCYFVSFMTSNVFFHQSFSGNSKDKMLILPRVSSDLGDKDFSIPGLR